MKLMALISTCLAVMTLIGCGQAHWLEGYHSRRWVIIDRPDVTYAMPISVSQITGVDVSQFAFAEDDGVTAIPQVGWNEPTDLRRNHIVQDELGQYWLFCGDNRVYVYWNPAKGSAN